MPISIVIPAHNEEKNIGLLLDSIFKQKQLPHEVIVAISPNTTDLTKKITQRYPAKIVVGGLLAVARNNGAKYAKSEIVIFMDADTALPFDDSLAKIYREFTAKKLDTASTHLLPDAETKANLTGRIAISVWNFLKDFGKLFPRPIIESGVCMISKTVVFKKVGGYREELPNGVPEDLDYTLRTIKAGYKYGVLASQVITSGRRYDSPFRAIKRLFAIATLGQLAMKTNLYKNRTYIKFYQSLYGELGGKGK